MFLEKSLFILSPVRCRSHRVVVKQNSQRRRRDFSRRWIKRRVEVAVDADDFLHGGSGSRSPQGLTDDWRCRRCSAPDPPFGPVARAISSVVLSRSPAPTSAGACRRDTHEGEGSPGDDPESMSVVGWADPRSAARRNILSMSRLTEGSA